jgi:D-serine deaminase-like pyridoxal phosphate-dependent protein
MNHPNTELIGAADARARLATPALVIERAALEANIAKMAAHALAHGIGLRPHAKTHKSADIARLQIAAGALGVCVAKIGEAEALHGAGVDDLLITSPLVTDGHIRRALSLRRASASLIVTIDAEAPLRALSEAFKGHSIEIDVLIDVDIGLHRTGCPPERAAALALLVRDAPGLRLRGLQGYAGHVQHLPGQATRAEAAGKAAALLALARDAVTAAGGSVEIVSGGGTGTFDLDCAGGVYTELQCGSYAFMDRQYTDVWTDGPLPFAPALHIESTVLRTQTAGYVTIDAGLKAMATEAGMPRLVAGTPDEAAYFFWGDEHGGIAWPGEPPPLGARVRLLTPHCDPTVDRYDVYHVMEGDRLVALWPVHARGRSA